MKKKEYIYIYIFLTVHDCYYNIEHKNYRINCNTAFMSMPSGDCHIEN